MVKVTYDNKVVRAFTVATLVWGIVGMLVGVIIALQMAHPIFNFELKWLSFGRLRPLHTNAVIFAFVGNGVFTAVYHSSQRLLKARMFNDMLSWIHFWGWQLIIVCAAVTLPLGLTSGKEYAELEWWIDILIAVVWVVFAINFFGTLAKRRERHIYVAIWFYIATIITVALLHIVNSLSLPVSFSKSYPIYAGVQDALVQWWYGHNAVAFFLTTPILGLLYYYVPKAVGRPIFSYRLSIVHFWAIVFLYIWTGPHHLLYTALPDWAQTVGMVFSVALLAPSWGGMINGLLTMRGAWDRVRTDPILKFFVAGITFYGMATFEGPLLSIKAVNSLSHYTDWTVGHVHSSALGWNGFMIFGMMYWLVPKIWKTKLYSTKLANLHFWVGTIGIVIYAVSMWIAGVTQGLMWKEFNDQGLLAYGSFIETVTKIIPYYWWRVLGGGMFFVATVIGTYNLYKTAMTGKVEDDTVEVPEMVDYNSGGHWHAFLEKRPLVFSILVFVGVAIGGIVEFLPTFLIESNVPTITAVKPYTPLEVEGRDIYIKEGCYNCHSQMIRPFRDEVARYGEYSKAGEFIYDRPFQWGSKRTGPDLHRVGGKYSNKWQLDHMVNPAQVTPGTNMPAYPWLAEDDMDLGTLQAKIKALVALGTPYSEDEQKHAVVLAQTQAKAIAADLASQGSPGLENKDVVALIAYLQRLGTDIDWKNAGN